MSSLIETVGQTYGSITDTQGRHMSSRLEGSALFPNGIDGRGVFPTNHKSLKEFMKSEADVYSLVRFFRSELSIHRLDMLHLMGVAQGLDALPLYVVGRKNSPIPQDKIPPAMIDVRRAAAGVTYAVEHMIAEGKSIDDDVTSDEIYQFSNGGNNDGKNYFMDKKNKDSCPAPEPVVKRVIDVMINPVETDISPDIDRWSDFLAPEEIENAITFAINNRIIINGYAKLMEEVAQGNMEESRRICQDLRRAYGKFRHSLGFDPDFDPQDLINLLIRYSQSHNQTS